jgi:hypothetical protein
MGRMTNRFLDSYGLLPNRKLRNEPNEQGSKCGGAGGFARQPPKLRNEPKKLEASVVGQAVSPANLRGPNRKLRNEPKKLEASVVVLRLFGTFLVCLSDIVSRQ